MKTIVIGGREVPMLRNALSPVIYRRIFHKDSLAQMNNIEKSEEPSGDVIDLYGEIAFVMAMQAAKQLGELKLITESDYYNWLNQFEDPYAILKALDEIVSYYNEQELSTSTAKKEEG